MGYKLLLVCEDGMMKNKKIKELKTLVFEIMSDFLHGQASLTFKEINQELKHPTLSNNGSQETRWMRASLSSIFKPSSKISQPYKLWLEENLPMLRQVISHVKNQWRRKERSYQLGTPLLSQWVSRSCWTAILYLV